MADVNLIEKIQVTKFNIDTIKGQVSYGCGDPSKLRSGDNVYRLDLLGDEHIATRDYIVNLIRAGTSVSGLKLSSDGRLIESYAEVEQLEKKKAKAADAIKKIVEKEIEAKGIFNYSLNIDGNHDPLPIEKLAAEYSDNDDAYEIACTIRKLSQELAKEHCYVSGGYFVSDEHDDFLVGKPGEVVRALTSTVQEMACVQDIELSDDDIQSALKNRGLPYKPGTLQEVAWNYRLESYGGDIDRALEEYGGACNRQGAPIWVICGKYNPQNPIDASEAMLAMYHNDKEACYGESGIYLDDAAVRVLLKYYAKVHAKKEPYGHYGDGSTPDEEITRTFKRLFKNVECLKEMGHKANNPQETFKNFVSAANSVRSIPEIEVHTKSFSQYIDMVLAMQEIMYKDSSNIKWGGISDPYRLNMDILYEGEARLTGTNIAVLEIPKACIKVEVYPMTLKVTSIK